MFHFRYPARPDIHMIQDRRKKTKEYKPQPAPELVAGKGIPRLFSPGICKAGSYYSLDVIVFTGRMVGKHSSDTAAKENHRPVVLFAFPVDQIRHNIHPYALIFTIFLFSHGQSKTRQVGRYILMALMIQVRAESAKQPAIAAASVKKNELNP